MSTDCALDAKAVRRYIQSHWQKTIRQPGSAASGVLDLPRPYPSPTANETFPFLCYWDSYFTSLGLWADGRDALVADLAENLLWLIEHYGYVPCYILDWDLTRSQNPVASILFRENYERNPDQAWLKRALRAMRREHAFWVTQRMTPSGLCRGFFHGGPDAVERFSQVLEERLGPVPKDPKARQRFLIEAMAEAETWDFTPRYGGRATDFNPIDLNAMVYVLECNLAWAAEACEENEEANRWRQRADATRQRINDLCWDEERGCYYDYDFRAGRRGTVLSAAVTFALWAGIPNESQAARCVERLRQLECEHGLPACEPGANRRVVLCQWDYPNAWPPLQASAVLGLRRYGYEEDARRIATKYLNTVCRHFKNTGQLWEKYNAQTGGIDVADEYPMPPMMGWSAGVFSFFHAWLSEERTACSTLKDNRHVPVEIQALWDRADNFTADTHLALRGTFCLERKATVSLRALGASSYDLYLDGKLLAEGPARFHLHHAEYDEHPLTLAPGRHVLAVHAHHEGETARIMDAQDPFFWAEISDQTGTDIPVTWKCLELKGYEKASRRISPLLGWIDWCDTTRNPAGWELPHFDDSSWPEPASRIRHFLTLDPPTLRPWAPKEMPMREIASGELVCSRGFTSNDPSYVFFLRELNDPSTPAQGTWRRFDLGKIRLGRPRLTLDLPEGAIIEIGVSETLEHGRIAPFINCAAGHSCNYDRFIARGGMQTFLPKTPKGGRFLEVHVIGDPAAIKWLDAGYLDRVYFEEREAGSFHCGDEQLNRIWRVGWETFRSCSEDVITDNPTRERGQWIGDALSIGIEINAAGSGDLSLARRSLKFAPWSADSLGRIPGLFPGIREFLPTYGFAWTGANLRYVELTGDRSLLEPLFPAAVRNLEAYLPHLEKDGLSSIPGTWTFVDWGYLTETNPFAQGEDKTYYAPVDLGLTLFYYEALKDITRWAEWIGQEDKAARLTEARNSLRESLATCFAVEKLTNVDERERLGYHACVLGLRNGVVPSEAQPHALAFIKTHLLRCFPNATDAPRLSDTSVMESRLITPSFCHFVFPLLIEAGEMDFVLDQYRHCWGWMLDQGLTTWPEVFDLRWSHCHQWAGCPTWQLSRYVLGLHPRFDLGPGHFILDLLPGSLPSAKGALPLGPESGRVTISWKQRDGHIHLRLKADSPVTLLEKESGSIVAQVDGEVELTL